MLTMSTLYAELFFQTFRGTKRHAYRSFKLETGGNRPHFHCSTVTLLLVVFPWLTVVLSMVSAVSKGDLKFLGL